MKEGFKKPVGVSKAAYGGHVPLEEMAGLLRDAGDIVSGPTGQEQKSFS